MDGLPYTDKDSIREIILYGTIGNTVDGNLFGTAIRDAESAGLTEIHIRINSDGGDIVNGLSIITSILATNLPVTTFIDGVAASMAGVIFLTGKSRIMNDFGLLMLHEPSFWGMKAEEIEDEKIKEALIRFRDMLVKIISNATTMSEEKVYEVLAQETWYNADEALKLGLVDEIIRTSFNDMFNLNATGILKNVAAKYQHDKIMEELKPITQILGLDENATVEAICGAISVLQSKVTDSVTTVDGLSARIEELEGDLESLNTETQTLKAENESFAVKAGEVLIAEGKISGKLTIGDALTLKGKRFEDVEKVLSAKTPPKKISDVIQTPEDVGALAKEWDTLFHKKGALAELKNSNPTRFAAIFKARFGTDYKKSS
jgi:ATP-dependent Clp protease protease subunit